MEVFECRLIGVLCSVFVITGYGIVVVEIGFEADSTVGTNTSGGGGVGELRKSIDDDDVYGMYVYNV